MPATRTQVVESKYPKLVNVNVTVPDGLVAPVELVSLAVAMQVEAWLTTTGVSHVTVVEVECLTLGVTVMS